MKVIAFAKSMQKLYKVISSWEYQECIPLGCVPPASMAISGGGVSAQGGCLPVWLYTPLPIACWVTPPPRTEFLTHAYENITFPQLLLRALITQRETIELKRYKDKKGMLTSQKELCYKQEQN